MKVRVIKTGEVHSVARDPFVRVLHSAGLIEYLPDENYPRSPQPDTTWSLARTMSSGELHVVASCANCQQKFPVFKPNEQTRFSHCGENEGVPKDILAEYRKGLVRDANAKDQLVERRA